MDGMLRKKSILMLIVMLSGILPALAQNVEVTGTVYDSSTKEPMPGVNILVEGNASIGTVTNIDGKYTIIVPSGGVSLVFSFVGYQTQTVPVQGRTVIDVSLEMASTELDEVVAIGYGTARKKDLTGSVSSVKGKDLQAIPVSTAVEALTGKMAGVQVTTTEGSPDAEVFIRVRGGGSITQSNAPLYIVDGFPVNTIADIPPSSIESIDVLKDASSTAIYGSRGANGVVIITTKEAKEGKVSVSYNTYYGYKRVAKTLNTISATDYVHWQYERALLVGGTELTDYFEPAFGLYQDIDLYNNQPKNDWFDQVFGRTGNTFNQDLTIAGGNENFKYSFAYAGIQSKEIMLDSDYKRNNISFKLENKPNDKVTLSFSTRYSKSKINGGGAIEQSNATPQDARVKQTMLYPSIPASGMVEFDDEDLYGIFVHPIKNVNDNDREQDRSIFNIGGSVAWKALKFLTLKTDGGLDRYKYDDYQFYGLTTYYVRNTPAATLQNMPAAILAITNRSSLRNTNTANFDFGKLIGNAKHDLNFLVGQEVIVTQQEKNTETVHGYPKFFNSGDAFKLTTQGTAQSINNSYDPDDKLISFFGRLNYSFNQKWLFTATFRADGSSKFSKGNQWGYFPSVAGAWRISEEQFMQSLSSVVSNLKLRASYGTAGNNNIPSGQIAQTFNSSVTTWINGATSIWTPSSVMANPDLKWETTYTRNVGLDFGLFSGKLNGSTELYWNNTKDLLINFPVPGSGYTTQYRNMGETKNRGIEFTLDWAAVNKKDFGLNLSFNIGFNKNKIHSLGVMEDFGQASSWASTEISADYWIAVGKPVGQMYGYVSDGRYEVSDFQGYNAATDTWTLKPGVADASQIVGKVRPGSMKLKNLVDTNPGDNIINADDRTVIGDANPKHTGGLTINSRFYGFDFTAAFSWSYGNDIYNADKIEFTTARDRFRNMIDIMAEGNRWTNVDANGNLVNDPATLEALNTNTTMWSPYSVRRTVTDWAIEDGSFLRCKTLSLGYTIPPKYTGMVRIQTLRVYASLYNAFILTNYSGFDPEVSTRRATTLTPGVDYSAYPKSRQLLFGINLTF